ncbi:methyltransferase domain-containing protein [Nannocystis sp.]|uniref:methyltransferase domain-containing protein n=1 Tax=Nannocystis sp. TaxID=1962667 RepID=UPI0025D2CC2B|nr:methyltransferase domain-containing protein [Nannocystis sp.]
MDLRSFKLHRPDRHVRAVLADHRGEHPHDLEGEPFARVLLAAAPLLSRLHDRLGHEPRALSVDGLTRVLRLTTEGDPPRPFVLPLPDLSDMSPEISALARAIVRELQPRGPDLPGTTPSDPAFWDHLYRADAGGWELGRPTPPLAHCLAADPPTGQRALVVGCGRGHEARLLAELGARVTAIDLAPAAIASARAATPPHLAIDFQVADLFALPRSPSFDLVLEHCCYCAIEPRRRREYVDAVADLLVPGGRLLGLFYAHGRPGGPPFTVSADELAASFARRFTVDALAIADDSVLLRLGEELLGRFTRH